MNVNFAEILSDIKLFNAVSIAVYMTLAMVLSVVFVGILMDGKQRGNDFIKWFSGSLMANIAMLLAESGLWLFDGNIEYRALTKIFAIGSYCLGYVVAACFAFCLVAFIRETAKKIPHTYAYIVSLFLAALSVFSAVGIWFELLVGFDDSGIMVYSSSYNLITVANGIVFFSEVVFVFYHRRLLGKKVFRFSIFGILSLASIPLLFIWDTIPLYVAVSLSLLIMNNIFRNEISSLAHRDTMTGLLNTTSYKKWASEFRTESSRTDAKYGLVVIDINYLKETNDNFGHDTGKNVIRSVAQIISGVFKRSTVFRVGGDEFIVVLKDRDLKNYVDLIDDVNERCRTEYIAVGDKRIAISVAYGVAIYNKDKDENITSVFNRADDAMYEHKRMIKSKTNFKVI